MPDALVTAGVKAQVERGARLLICLTALLKQGLGPCCLTLSKQGYIAS